MAGFPIKHSLYCLNCKHIVWTPNPPAAHRFMKGWWRDLGRYEDVAIPYSRRAECYAMCPKPYVSWLVAYGGIKGPFSKDKPLLV